MVPHSSTEDRYPTWRAACLLLAALALGAGIQVRDGLVAPAAIAWLSFATFAAVAAFVRLSDSSVLLQRFTRMLPHLAIGGLLIQLLQHFFYEPPENWHGTNSTAPYYLDLAVAAIAMIFMVAQPRRGNLAFGVAVVAFAAAGSWLLIASTHPRIDVWTAQTAGLDAALHGQDPWSSSFPDIYNKPDLYAPGTVRDGRTYLGFPYPPVTFLMDLPAHLLAHDYRWSNLASMILTAILISRLQGGMFGKMAALVFLFTPRALLVLLNGWTEPTVVLLLVATIYSMRHRPNWTPWLLGILLASKQYMFIAVAPAILLIPPQNRLRWCAKVVAAGLIVSLPLILWNLPAYIHANFAAASGAAFRYDAMSYFAYWAATHEWTPPSWIGLIAFAATAPVTWLAVTKAERSPAGFPAALSLVMIVFFSLNKFAFCNYYYLIIATLCASVGATAFRETRTAEQTVVLPLQPRLAA